MEFLKEKKQYGFVIRQLTLREIKRKYARSYLGILWSVLNPLLSMSVLSLIFSQMFRRSIENYPIYYLTGYILWQAFTGATNSAMTTLADNKMLLLKVKFPMELFILARVYTAFLNLGYSLIAYGFMLVVFQVTPRWSMLMGAPVIGLLMLFSLGMSYILAAAYIFFGDVKHLYTVFLTLWMYSSAIFYPADQLSGVMHQVILQNPMYVFIHCMRKGFMYGELPLFTEIVQMLLWSAGIFLLGHLIFRLCRNRIMQRL